MVATEKPLQIQRKNAFGALSIYASSYKFSSKFGAFLLAASTLAAPPAHALTTSIKSMAQPETRTHANRLLPSNIQNPMKPAKKENWLVRFGPHEWARHTYERPGDDPIRLLGSVRRGPQLGALGITADEKYVQVVGDLIVPLNQGQIKQAIAKCKAFETRLAAATTPYSSYPFSTPHAPRVAAPPPVVVVKRRRIPVMA